MTVLVSDSFNRANSTATLGSTDSYNGGAVKVWNVLIGPIGINNNQAYVISTTTQNALAVIDAGQSDVTISINIQSDTSVLGGIYARVVNSNSWIRLVKVSPGSLYLQTFDGTTTTTLATKTGLTFASGDLLKLTLQGNTLTAYFNGTSVITATSSFNQTATQHGFGIQYKGSSTYFDNFQIEDLNTGGTIAISSTVKSNSSSFSNLIGGTHLMTANTVKSNTTSLVAVLKKTVASSSMVTSHSSATNVANVSRSVGSIVKSNSAEMATLTVSGTTVVPVSSTVKSNSSVNSLVGLVTRRLLATVKSNSNQTGIIRNSIQVGSTVTSHSNQQVIVTITAPNFQVYLRSLKRSNSFAKPVPLGVIRKLNALNKSTTRASATLFKLTVVNNMIEVIRFKRGQKNNLPSLQVGEPAVTTDTNEMYVGMANGNVKVPTQPDLDSINSSLAQNMSKVINVVKLYNADSTGTNYTSTAIQNAINANTKRELFLEDGTYKLDASLVINNPIKLTGQSRDGTILLVDSLTNIDVFQLWSACEISNLTIQFNNPSHAKTAFKYFATLTGNSNGRIKNIKVIGTGYANQTKVIELGYDPSASNNNAYVFFWNFEDFIVDYCMSVFYTEADFTKMWTTACTFDKFIINHTIRSVWFNTPYVLGWYSRYDFLNWQFQSHANMGTVFEAPSDRSIVDIHVWDKFAYSSSPKAFNIKGRSSNNTFKIRNLLTSDIQLEKPSSGFQNTFQLSDDTTLAKNVIVDTTIYVDAVNGSDSNGDGSQTNTYKTIASTLNLLPKMLNSNITIQLVDAIYSETITMPKFYGNGSITIQGTTATGTKVNAISMTGNRVITTFRNMTVQNVSGGIAILAADSETTYFYTVHVVPNGVTPTYGYYIQGTRALIRSTPQISNCTNAIYVSSTGFTRVDAVTGSGNTNGFVASNGIISYTANQPGGFATTPTSISSGGVINSLSYGFGAASIVSGTTSIVVTHGLGSIPSFISATPQGNVGNVWITGASSTQFTINCSAAPGSNTQVTWHARA